MGCVRAISATSACLSGVSPPQAAGGLDMMILVPGCGSPRERPRHAHSLSLLPGPGHRPLLALLGTQARQLCRIGDWGPSLVSAQPVPSFLSPGDLRAAGQQLPPPRHHGLGVTVSRGSSQGIGGGTGHAYLPLLPPPPPLGLSWGSGLASPLPTVICVPILVPGLHLRPSVWRPPYAGLPEPGHRLCGCPARL